mmetsp:Transcript_14951/g.22258  ORF Transcript_14951/g.22258 Transcript_14951/m.22258 type:complete len:280 (+) Transcript_14951:60-899(+)
MKIQVLLCFTIWSAIEAFVLPNASKWKIKQYQPLKMSSKCEESFEKIFSKIESGQETRQSDHAESLNMDKFDIGAMRGTIKGYLGSKIDWCSKLNLTGEDGFEKYSLMCWTFPMYNTPHLSIDIEKTTEKIFLKADLIPKEDLMYSQDYLEEFYEGGVLEWYNDLVENQLSEQQTPSKYLRDRVLTSPTVVHISLPNSKEGDEILESGVEKLVDLWLGFLSEASEIPRMRRGTMLSRDSILRRMSFLILNQNSIFGARAQEVAVALVGPGDQAYIGQAS